jgi:hypothetical protein
MRGSIRNGGNPSFAKMRRRKGQKSILCSAAFQLQYVTTVLMFCDYSAAFHIATETREDGEN